MANSSSKSNPQYRRLQAFTLDPSIDMELENALVSRAVLKIPWEELQPGPVGEYIEVIDVDPSSGKAYAPVDLNQYLATDGLAPSLGDPQFHQQMAYAIAMLTIRNFERIIGRDVMWSERQFEGDGNFVSPDKQFVQRLRIYPHAIRQQNAYYSPTKKALLFGYFNAPTPDPSEELPGGLVFTCLSHDIVAHETTHAILDGIHRRLLDATNPDMLAFHEAFADIVGIFQHFTLPDLLLNQIQRTRGRLDRDNLLAQLASQFGRATGRGGALRNALGLDDHRERMPPDPNQFSVTTEPHERGAILVAAVFEAFLAIYNNRVADLLRIASDGTGLLPDGDIHPDLAKRLADEAVKAADRVLTICVRAVDYLPPVDITIGDYMRALITADTEAVPDDPRRYRLAFVEAFRNRGIYPLDIRTLSEESLRWQPLHDVEWGHLKKLLPSANVFRTVLAAYAAPEDYADAFRAMRKAKSQRNEDKSTTRILYDQVFGAIWRQDFDLAEKAFLNALLSRPAPNDGGSTKRVSRRERRHLLGKIFAMFLHQYVESKARTLRNNRDIRDAAEWTLGMDLGELFDGEGRWEIHAVRPKLRTSSDNRSKIELLIMLTQSKLYPLDANQKLSDKDEPKFKFRGGCTLLIDPDEGKIRYAIGKRLKSEHRLKRQREFFDGVVANEEEAGLQRLGLRTRYLNSRERLEPLVRLHADSSAKGGY